MTDQINGALGRSAVGLSVVEDIRRNILKGDFPDGSRLTEEGLAAAYGISRGSIRAVLQQLQKEGLIRILENGGRQVAGFFREHALQLYDFREYIEITALEQLLNRTGAPLSTLTELLEHPTGTGQELRVLDIAFHRQLVALADNRFLLGAFDNIAPVLNTVFLLNISTYEEQFAAGFHASHMELVIPLLQKDREKSVRVLRAHLQNAREITLRVVESLQGK